MPQGAVQGRPQDIATLVFTDRQLACGSRFQRDFAAASSRRSSNSASIAAASGWLAAAPCNMSNSGVMRLNSAG
jgi:hypothetical protein